MSGGFRPGRAPGPLPEVATPSPRIATRSLVHRNPFATVSAVHADFGSFAKDYYVVDFGPRAGIVAVNEGRVLLTAQYRFLLDRVAWEIPGGRVDDGESPEQTAQRECLEETGFSCDDLHPLVTASLVVEDGSTDDSCAVEERLAAEAPTLRLIRRGRNTGVNAAINRGLAEVRGDFVCFSAADDVVGPDFARHSLELIARHPAAGFCFSDPAEMDSEGGGVQPLPLRLADRPCLLRPSDVEALLTRNFFAFPDHAT